jgi:SSS family transporter
MVAGGAYFPSSLFKGGEKAWVDDIYRFHPDSGRWQTLEPLEIPSAYGASVSTPEGILFIGGHNRNGVSDRVIRFRCSEHQIQRDTLPSLPHSCTMMSAAVLDDRVYVAGGQKDVPDESALGTFWTLDLETPQSGWRALEPWPGPPRILPVLISQNGQIYLISGCELIAGPDGKTTRRFLTDAYSYRPGEGWHHVAPAPHPMAGAPAVAQGPSHIVVFGGDTGEHFNEVWELKNRHPGFSREVWGFNTITNTWVCKDTLPQSVVTTTAVHYDGGVVIPGGEDRPGHRSPAVWMARPRAPQNSFGLINSLVLGFYLLALVLMGGYFSRREKTTDDFFLGGRRIPWWAAGISIYGTQLSAITFMAVPAKAFATNWVFFMNAFTIVLVAPVVVYYYLPFFRRLQVTTAYEYLEKRFNLPVRLFGSTAFILFQLGRIGIVIFLPAIALSTVTGIPIALCILMMGILSTLYTVLGGIEAVIWTDVLQVVVLVGGALLSLVVITLGMEGGFFDLLLQGADDEKFHMINWSWDLTTASIGVMVFGTFLNNLIPYTSDQTVIQRYLTTRDEKQAARSIWTNAALAIPSTLLFFLLGTALYVFYKHHAAQMDMTIPVDAVFPWFITTQLPAGLSGLVIAGLFAAAMSSLDSSMNSISTALMTDFIRRFRAARSGWQDLVQARWLTALIGLIGTASALLMASFEIKSLWDLFFQILGLLGSSLAGIFVLGIFTRRAHGRGALVGAIASAVVLLMVQVYTTIHFMLYAAVGILSCVLVGYLFSVVLPADEPKNELNIYDLHGKHVEDQ